MFTVRIIGCPHIIKLKLIQEMEVGINVHYKGYLHFTFSYEIKQLNEFLFNGMLAYSLRTCYRSRSLIELIRSRCSAKTEGRRDLRFS